MILGYIPQLRDVGVSGWRVPDTVRLAGSMEQWVDSHPWTYSLVTQIGQQL